MGAEICGPPFGPMKENHLRIPESARMDERWMVKAWNCRLAPQPAPNFSARPRAFALASRPFEEDPTPAPQSAGGLFPFLGEPLSKQRRKTVL